MINSVRIDAITYKVSETKDIVIVDNKECRAKIDYNTAEIVISDREQTCKNDRKTHALVHEIVHGIIYERGLSSMISNEETVCDEFSSAFIGLIRDNPDLIDFIQGKTSLSMGCAPGTILKCKDLIVHNNLANRE